MNQNAAHNEESKDDKKNNVPKPNDDKLNHAPVEEPPNPDGVEGEGSYTATHRYNEGVAKSIAKGRTEDLAEKAKEALEGPEGEELRKAEAIGKGAGNA